MMALINPIRKTLLDTGTEIIVRSAPLLTKITPVRHASLHAGELFFRYFRNENRPVFVRPPGVISDRADFKHALMHTVDRAAANVSPTAMRGLISSLLRTIFIEGGDQKATDRFYAQNGTYPPSFLTISPGKACNLHCEGCYASSGLSGEKLDWTTFDRIITEAKTLWGVRFFVISGGEPLAYRSEGKGILDAAKKHSDCFFLMYTNGTLINEQVAQRLAILGNLTPAISVEGWKETTDKRRGQGVFDKVLNAMEQLRQAGVLFGISLTATRHNTEEILSDEFIDFFFEQQGAIYGWLFHYMPIGRSFTLDLLPTIQQRKWMWQRSWEIIHNKHIFLADFWNHATLSDGCIAAGRTRGGGYLYIDWNGAVSPCVFVPYSPVNVKETFAGGGTLNDIWKEPFFTGIRDWQEGYCQKEGNLLAPCIIRDHHAELRKLISANEPDPTDENARKALLDPEYAKGLVKYGKQYQLLTDQIWRDQYLQEQEAPADGDEVLARH